ncbi:MAG: putative toxin-antitoxin system toxin component, PIN family [Verrucomicrobia bacterium]|jgi:putative PIN family toxin of toxin-antitoxin system|nr:putative toxin-antitoxin system toxin component, PIN family [Verrucomicrobiota bacterium]MBT7069173.1 putative toxin-antitoxin system toxin component, PIN family [Verrucomicrobiota bacterium]MBT7699607.1 putative toxin-antitoxin system toxin component, PIN family [Verrucomicrobiota bacterium]
MSLVRVVIDTNVLVSGLRSRRGMSYRMLSFLGGRLYRPVVTVPLVVEYEKSLCDPRTEVPFSAIDIERYLSFVCSVSDCRKVHFLWRPFLRDPKDDMVLEAAVSGRCEYIVTFNLRDFRDIGKFGIVAITPGDFLKEKGKEK